MSINRIDIEKISEVDLQELKDNAVGEGIQYDYKLDLYGNADKREFLKDRLIIRQHCRGPYPHRD